MKTCFNLTLLHYSVNTNWRLHVSISIKSQWIYVPPNSTLSDVYINRYLLDNLMLLSHCKIAVLKQIYYFNF